MIYLVLSLFYLFIFPDQMIDGEITWLTPTTYDFGDLRLNKPVEADFIFQNNGEVPFSIDNVRPACGCTATEWTDKPVMPGEQDTIRVEFDARNSGYFYKKITVFFSNQRRGEKLYIEGYVE